MSFGGGGNWMGGYMSQILGLDAQQSAQRENDWRQQRDWKDRQEFMDTLERQKKAEDLARQQAELRRQIDPEISRALRDQHPGLSAGLQDEEVNELAGLRGEQGNINSYLNQGSDPNFAGPRQPELEGPPAPSTQQGQAQKKLARLKFLEEKEKAALQRPMTVRQAEDMKKYGLGYPRSSQRRSTDDEIALIRERGEVRKKVEDNKQKHLQGRFDISTEQKKAQFDQMMAYRYAALRQSFQKLRFAKSSDERVAAMRALQTEASQTEAALARLNSSINSLAEDPSTQSQAAYLIQKRQELMQYLGPARETLSRYGVQPSEDSSGYEYEGGSAPSNVPLNPPVEGATGDDVLRKYHDANIGGSKFDRADKTKKANGDPVKSAIDEANSLF